MSGKQTRKQIWLLALTVLVLALVTPACGETVSPTPEPTAITGPTNTPTPAFERTEAQVIEVVDGDTIKVEVGGTVYTVRYIGIDTPETVHPSKPVQWMGPEASEINRRLVEGQMVYLEKDVSETDKYGRLLRYVYLADGTFVNAELVRLGYAQMSTYPPDVRYQDLFLEMQQDAREAERGLWGLTPTPRPLPTATPIWCICAGNIDCSNFSTQAHAQACYNLCMFVTGKDVHRLDIDNNGKACEDLP